MSLVTRWVHATLIAGAIATFGAAGTELADSSAAVDNVMAVLTVSVALMAPPEPVPTEAELVRLAGLRASILDRRLVRTREANEEDYRLSKQMEAEGTPDIEFDVVCSPTCSVIGLHSKGRWCARGSCTGDRFVARTARDAARVLSFVPRGVMGAGATRGLRFERVHSDGTYEYAIFRRELVPGIPCDRDVVVSLGENVRISLERYDGVDELPREATHTRGEARDAVYRELSALEPREVLVPSSEGPIRRDGLLIVSIAGRAKLVHRFFFELDTELQVVDVDDATLEVVRFEEWSEARKAFPR